MDTASTLIRIYLFICQRYWGRLAAVAQRQTGNSDPAFSDEEVLTICVFGLIKKRTTISENNEYMKDHFLDWCPDLPSYQSYNRRLHQMPYHPHVMPNWPAMPSSRCKSYRSGSSSTP